MKENILYLKNNKIDDFVGREFPQNCGDILKVIKKSEKRSKNGISLYECEFIKYPKEVLAQRGHIIRGNIKNPLVEIEEFINKIWPQHCGDSLKIIEKSKKADNKGEYLWECEFIKYPYKILTYKNKILKGCVNNPLIEENEFIGQEFLQHCGDILKVIKKTDKKQNNISLYECEFIKYPCKIYVRKSHIKEGIIINPQIEIEEFQNKIWPQHCGDSLRIIKKLNKKQNNNYLWECEFIEYPCKIISSKGEIQNGKVNNYNLPWWNKENLIRYIQENFKEKPTIKEISNSLEKSTSFINKQINQFCLQALINYNYIGEENQVRDFIKSIYQGPIEKYCGTKEEKFREIDIFLPKLKKGIEYNGSPWHEEGNPNNPYSKSIGYHKEKQEIFAQKEIDILYIWDYEWFEDFPKNKIINEQTKQKIREFLNI